MCSSSNAAVDIIASKLLKIRSKISSPGNFRPTAISFNSMIRLRPEKQKLISLVRFGVMDSMHPDVQSIALQNLAKRTISANSNYSVDVQSLIDEVNPLPHTNSLL